MSANRQGTENPQMIYWEKFLEVCTRTPICRVQGKVAGETQWEGRLVRYNRSVEVRVHTAQGEGSSRCVHAERVRWDWRKQRFVYLGERMLLRWVELDWVTWKACGDPNYTWRKVV